MPRVIAGVPVPDTARAILRARINMAASEALFRYVWPTEIRGFTRVPCPGDGHDGAWTGSWSCGVGHVHWNTNHNRLT